MGSKYFLRLLLFLTIAIWLAVLSYPDRRLHIIGCSVGQGDAFLIINGSNQILVDGGPNNKVLDCLGKYLPFWDRKIELVVLTHPQKDHYQGLIEVFKRYQVETYFATGLDASSEDWQVLKNEVGGGGTKIVKPTTGLNARLGLMRLEIVNPSEVNVLGDPNDFSVVFNLSYENFDGLFTGDIGPAVTDGILATGRVREVEFLKVPHHGSKNGLTEDLLKATSPEIAAIGVGKNPWGHPHREVLQMLEKFGVKTLRTDKDGDIEIISDGQKYWQVN